MHCLEINPILKPTKAFFRHGKSFLTPKNGTILLDFFALKYWRNSQIWGKFRAQRPNFYVSLVEFSLPMQLRDARGNAGRNLAFSWRKNPAGRGGGADSEDEASTAVLLPEMFRSPSGWFPELRTGTTPKIWSSKTNFSNNKKSGDLPMETFRCDL